MRRSLVLSTMLVVLTAVICIAVPVSFLVRRTIHAEVQYRLDRQAEALGQHFTEEVLKGEPIAHEVQADTPPNHRVDLVLADGTSLTAGPQTRFSSEMRAVADGPNQSKLILATTGDAADDRTATAILIVAVTSILVIALSGLLAMWQARKVSAPLTNLVAAADEMSGGDLSREAPHSGMPEIDAVAEALNRLTRRVNELVQAERDFSSNASHQLRSGLTSLRLRLEALVVADHDDAHGDARAALAQAEKLSDTVADLLQLARTGRVGTASRYDLARVIRHHVARIEPEAHALGREIRVVSNGTTAEVVGSPSAIGETVDVLLSNAVEHGRGEIAVEVSVQDGILSITVSDEGEGIADEAISTLFDRHPDTHGHGIGLALARTLIEAEGGRLDLVQPRPPVFRLVLPPAPEG